MFVRRWPSAASRRCGVARLVDDLGRLEVTPEPELASGAERAAHRTPGLARDAQRVPLARCAARRVVHQDRLDQRAVVESMERLLGLPAVGEADLRVGDRVEPERRRQRIAERRRQRPDRGGLGHAAVLPDRIGDLAARYDGSPCASTHAASSSGVTPGDARGADRSSASRDDATADDRRPTPHEGVPRHAVAARRLDLAEPEPRPSPAPRPSRRTCRARGPAPAPGSAAPDDQPTEVGLDEGPRPRLVGPHLALELGGRTAPDRGGRPPGATAGSIVAPASGCGAAVILPRSHGPRYARRAAPAASTSRVSSSDGVVSSPSSATRIWATIGPVSSPASMRMSVTPVSVSPARIAAGIGVAPRWRGSNDGWRFNAPCAELQERSAGRSGRSRRARRGPGDERQDAVDGGSIAQPRRRQDRADPRWRAASWIGVTRRPARRGPPVVGGAVTTPTSSTSGCSPSRQRVSRPNPPLPMKTVRARPSVTPGRSSPRGPRRRPRRPGRRGSARPSTRGSRCRACPRGGRARAGCARPSSPAPLTLNFLPVAVLGDDPDLLAARRRRRRSPGSTGSPRDRGRRRSRGRCAG